MPIRRAGTKGDVALETHQGPGSGDGGFVQGGITGINGDETRALGTLLTGDDSPRPVGVLLSSIFQVIKAASLQVF